MPTTTITFELPEEANELLVAQKGRDFFCALWDIAQKIRRWRKDDELTDREECYLCHIESLVYGSGVDEIE